MNAGAMTARIAIMREPDIACDMTFEHEDMPTICSYHARSR